MKRLLSIFIALTFVTSLSSCTKQNSNVKKMIEEYAKYDSTGERYDCYLPDYMEIPDFTTFEVPNITYTATEDIIEKQLKRDVAALSGDDEAAYGTPVKEGDIVEISTTCWYKDEVFSGYTFAVGNEQAIVIGCNELDAPELDQNIIGMMEGETKKFDFKFPDPYYRDLKMSGETATIEVTVAIHSPIIYKEVGDDFFSLHYGFPKEDYKAVVKTRLEEQYNEYIESYKSDLVWEYLYDNTKIISYPEERDTLYNDLYDDYRTAASANSKTFLEYVKEKHGYDSIEEFEEYLNEYTNEYAKREMIIYFIARANNLKYTQEYYEAELLEYCETFEIKELADAESFVDFQVGLDQFKERIQLNYVYDWIGDNAPVREDVTTYKNDLNKDKK